MIAARRRPLQATLERGRRALLLHLILITLSLLIAAPASASDLFASGRLWRISKSGIPDSYVLGTIHVADMRVAIVTAPIAAAMARSRVYAVELVPEAADTATSEFEQMDNNARLEPLLGAATYAAVRDQLSRHGLTEPVIERLKPWAAMMKISRASPQREQATLDDKLFVAARMRRLQILPLELLEEQISAFDAVPQATQIALLTHALEHRDALTANVEPTIAAWLSGDLAALARITERSAQRFPQLREHYERLARHLIVDRTALMHHRLFMPLRKGRVFVAIGALHLYGDNGLLALLSADGYQVQKLW